MANYKLTQTGAKVQADLDLTEHIQDEFSSSSTYAVGALVIYNTKIYRCHTAVSSAGEWTGSTNWTEQKLNDLLNLKQNTLTFDNTPTSASTNPVTSGGVYTALSNKQASSSVLTSISSQSSGTGLLKLTNGAASLDTNSYLTSHLYRPIKVDGVQKLANNVNTALDLVAGTNITLSESDGAVTINASGGGSYDLATTQDINRLFETEYTITTSVTNGTYTGDTSIWTSETATVTVSANQDYTLPETITVSGATYTYDNSTGVITLSNATGNITITAICTSAAPTLYLNADGVYYAHLKYRTAMKIGSAPTSVSDYDYLVNIDVNLRDKNGNIITTPLALTGVTDVYLFRYYATGASSFSGGYYLNTINEGPSSQEDIIGTGNWSSPTHLTIEGTKYLWLEGCAD